MNLSNLELLPPVPLQALPDEIAAAEICLGGHFGISAKAGRVVAGKVYQILAMRRPLIATTTLANLALLCQAKNAWLCPPNDPQSLAASILKLSQDQDLRSHLAENGYRLYEEQCSEKVITKKLKVIVEKMLARK
jgi:glycosyltransferase involved in cell wall biosynthesis